jgi:hypothetical protein
MGWVYYFRLVNTKFQADCLAARFEDGADWVYHRTPQYVSTFRTQSGRYGIKIFW